MEEEMSVFRNIEFKNKINDIQCRLEELKREYDIHFSLQVSTEHGDHSGIFVSAEMPIETTKLHADLSVKELQTRLYIESLIDSGFVVLYCKDNNVFNQISTGVYYIMTNRYKIQNEWFAMIEGLGERLFPLNLFKVLRKKQELS